MVASFSGSGTLQAFRGIGDESERFDAWWELCKFWTCFLVRRCTTAIEKTPFLWYTVQIRNRVTFFLGSVLEKQGGYTYGSR